MYVKCFTKIEFFQTDQSTRMAADWPCLIDQDIFGFSSATAEQILTKLDRKEVLNMIPLLSLC